MIIKKTGEVCDGFYVLGSAIAPVYLLDGPTPIIFDGGFTALAQLYETQIKEVLNGRKPEYIFLTHSHFDHIGAVGYFKKIWPNLKAGGSSKCHDILLKQSAVKLMKKLSLESTEGFKKMGISPINEAPFEPFNLDFQIKTGIKIEISSDFSMVPIHTPGHTWDFISYWIPEKKILIASEAVAVYETNGYIQSEFLVDADAYLDSLKKFQNLGATLLCAGHYAVFTDNDVLDHIHNSIKATNNYLAMAEELLIHEKGNIDGVVSKIKIREWDTLPWPKQSESAYLINTRQRIKIIKERQNR